MVPVDPETWSRDLADLGVDMVRIDVGVPHGDDEFDEIEALINACMGRGVRPLVVLTGGIASGNPNEPLQELLPGEPETNAYIQDFAAEAAAIVTALPGVDHFEVWNEPGEEETFLERANFASLVHYTAKRMREIRSVTVISGGLLYNDETPIESVQDIMAPLTAPLEDPNGPGLYTWMTENGLPYPWDHLGIHTYFEPTTIEIAGRVLDVINQNRPQDDENGIWLTEFGDSRNCASEKCDPDPNAPEPDASAPLQANNLDRWYAMLLERDYLGALFWFSHHQTPHTVQGHQFAHFGLTGYVSEGLEAGSIPEDQAEALHWPSWGRLQALAVR